MALHRLLARNAGQEQILEAYCNVAALDFRPFHGRLPVHQ
jgi:hypothetical protein